MQNQMIWFERKFDFDFPAELYPMTVERLRGTPARMEEKLADMSPDILTRKPDEGWSIQRQAGHLIVVEQLWIGRLEDFLVGQKILRPADVTNRLTEQTDFDARTINPMLSEFRSTRMGLVDRLYDLTIEQAESTALHPRLNQPMRLIDAFHFAAEHDDHHLSRMTDLIVRFQ